jgi:hypothetical protein
MMRATVVQPFVPPSAVRYLALVVCHLRRPHHVRHDLLGLALVGVAISHLVLVLQSTAGPQLSPAMPPMVVHDRGYPGS